MEIKHMHKYRSIIDNETAEAIQAWAGEKALDEAVMASTPDGEYPCHNGDDWHVWIEHAQHEAFLVIEHLGQYCTISQASWHNGLAAFFETLREDGLW
jgi:hypothetical protein